MRVLKQSTAVNIAIFMTDSSDHVTGKTGLTLTITASKAAASFASISPTVTELANGWYKLALTTSHTDTVGDFALHITGTGADPSDILCQVTARLWDDLAYPATSGRSMVVDAAGLVDACIVKAGASGSGTAWGSGAITAAAIASDAITAAKIADGAIDAATFAAGAITASAIAADAIGASELAADAVSEIAAAISIPSAATIADAVWDEATLGHTTSGTFGAQAVTILNAQTSQLDGIVNDTEDIQSRLPAALVGGRIDASVGAMATDTLTSTALAASAASEIATAVLTTSMTESYASDGSAMTLAQACYMLLAVGAEFSISGTTLTCKKLDGSTTAMTFTLNDATNPTSRTRAS